MFGESAATMISYAIAALSLLPAPQEAPRQYGEQVQQVQTPAPVQRAPVARYNPPPKDAPCYPCGHAR